MTTPFTTYAFPATGAPTSRTMPNRLIDIINVKDFGAKGDSVTDDWAAIMAAYNHTSNDNRGTVFFPPGTYLVSQPIDFTTPIQSVGFLGVMGASTITGNFNDYIFRRYDASDPLNYSGYAGFHAIEKLAIINIHATGGGILMGGCVGASIRDCNVTANKGINTGNPNELASFEVTIENCTLSPGSNPSGSLGLMLFGDGPAINCYVNGFSKGAICVWGNQGGALLLGCRFENCDIGFQPGAKPDGSTGGGGGFVVEGGYFNNNSMAIYVTTSGGTFRGVRITGTNGQAPGGANPQYGIQVPQGQGTCVYEGIVVDGQFDQYGIFIGGNELTPVKSNMFGVSSINSGSGSAWGSGVSPVANMSNVPFTKLAGCNVASVTTTDQLFLATPITSVTCPANTVTLTWAFGNLGPLTGQTFDIRVSGVPVGGYNGIFQGTITGTNTLTYTVVGPLANSSGGDIVINYKDLNEGDCFNVSDAITAIWGAEVTAGGGSNHAKVCYNGTNLTVVGK